MALLLTCTLAGCRHKAVAPPPPVATAPPITPASITVITPLPSVPPQSQPNVQQAQAQPPAPEPAPLPVKRKRRIRRKPAVPAPAETAQATPPAAAPAAPLPVSTEPATASAGSPTVSTSATEAAPSLGELSAGTTITNTERTRILKDIQQQEGRLAKVKEPATPDARAVQMQVRSFLAKARQAVTENDVDGAQTLNTKARLLLDELESE